MDNETLQYIKGRLDTCIYNVPDEQFIDSLNEKDAKLFLKTFHSYIKTCITVIAEYQKENQS